MLQTKMHFWVYMAAKLGLFFFQFYFLYFTSGFGHRIQQGVIFMNFILHFLPELHI